MEEKNFLFIGVPAFNEEKSIERMLNSVFRQDLWRKTPSDRKQILVCANGCTDRTVRIVKALQASHPEIKLIELKEANKPSAWNAIKRNAPKEAKILFFADADVILGPRTLSRMWRDFQLKKEVQVISSSAIPIKESAKNSIVKAHNEPIIKFAKENPPNQISGALYGIRRDAAERTRIPKYIISEDLFLSCVFEGKVFRDPKARVYFKLPQTVKEIINLRLRGGKAIGQLKALNLMSKKFSEQRVSRSIKSLKELNSNQKLLRVLFLGLSKGAELKSRMNPLKGHKWKQLPSTKIPKKI